MVATLKTVKSPYLCNRLTNFDEPLHPKKPSSLASSKSRLVLPFWYWLTQVVPEKRLLNGCSVVVQWVAW